MGEDDARKGHSLDELILKYVEGGLSGEEKGNRERTQESGVAAGCDGTASSVAMF